MGRMDRLARRARGPRRIGLLEAAGHGAVAGLLGGVAMTLLDRAVVPRLGGRDPRIGQWDRQVARGARHAGVRLVGRQRTLAGVATTLVYGAAVGALYGVARERLRGVDAATSILDTGLVYAATLVAGGPASPARGERPSRASGAKGAKAAKGAKGAKGAVQRGSGPAVFGRATATAFHYLTR